MRTISQIAKELNITKQAVYKKVNNQLKAELQQHIFKAENTTMIDDEGVSIIKKSLVFNSNTQDNQQSINNQPSDTLNNIDLINFLQEQIRVKDNQIDNQQTTINSLVEKLGNMQVLLLKQEQSNILDDKLKESTPIAHESESTLIVPEPLTQEQSPSTETTQPQEPTHAAHEIQVHLQEPPASFWKHFVNFFKR